MKWLKMKKIKRIRRPSIRVNATLAMKRMLREKMMLRLLVLTKKPAHNYWPNMITLKNKERMTSFAVGNVLTRCSRSWLRMKETLMYTRSIRLGLDAFALRDGQESREDIFLAASSKRFHYRNLTKLLLWSSHQIKDLLLSKILTDSLTILKPQQKSREMQEKMPWKENWVVKYQVISR